MNYQYKCRICGSNNCENVLNAIRDWEYGFNGLFSYCKCVNCHSVQVHPFPDIDDLIEAYKVDYHGYAAPTRKGAIYSFLYKISEWFAVREIKRHVAINSKVLDVGCGVGLFLSKLKSMGLNNIEGIDFTESAAEAVRSKGISCYTGPFIDFKKEAHSYDIIVMNNYLEHTQNPLEELRKARLLLKDTGALLCELPNFDSFDRFLFGKYWGGNHVPRHTFQFNNETLTLMLKQAGFTNIHIKHPLNTSHFVLSIQN